MISKNLTVILCMLAVSTILWSKGSYADEPTEKNLSAVTCRDVLLASGDERDGQVLRGVPRNARCIGAVDDAGPTQKVISGTLRTKLLPA